MDEVQGGGLVNKLREIIRGGDLDVRRRLCRPEHVSAAIPVEFEAAQFPIDVGIVLLQLG